MSKRIKTRIMLLMPIVMALFFVYTPAKSNATYYPEGPQQNVSKQTLIDGGWTLCWEDYYNSYTSLETIFSQCTGDYLILAGGATGADSYLLLAAGERSVITTRTGQNETILNNGSYWYNHSGWGSIGFAPNSTIQQSSADVYDAWGGDSGHLRLSWHSDGTNVFGGWRVGMIIGLNGSTEYQRAIWQTGGISLASPTPTPTEEPTPTPTPTEEPTPTPTPTEEPTPTPSPSESQIQNPAPSPQNPTPDPVLTQDATPEIEPEPQEIVEEEQTLEPSEEPTPIVEEIINEPIISEEEQVDNAIEELIVNEEEITDEQLENITELLLANYEIDEVMPIANLIEALDEEQLLELLDQLDPNQEIEYIEGVILEAGVAAIFVQLSDPAALFAEVLSNPAQVVEALGQLGADMTQEEREQSEEVIVAAVIVTQLIGSVTTGMVTQLNARAEIRRIV